MKKLLLFLFIAITAIAMILISIFTFNPKVDSWSSLLAGVAIGLLILLFKPALAYIKARKQKSAK